MKRMKLLVLGLSLLTLSVVAFSGVTTAQSVKTGNTVTVAAGEQVNSLLVANGTNIDIAGTVDGDVFCAGQTITISGTVRGDVFCAGQTINVSGKVDGSARLAGQTVSIGGTISGSATVASQTLLLEKSGLVQRDLSGGAQTATLSGTIRRDLAIGASSVTINGQVGRNIKGGIETLTVGSTGRVGGDVIYTSNTAATVSPGGTITGTVTRTPQTQQPKSNAYTLFELTLFSVIYSFVTLLILALALALLIPSVLREASSKTLSSPGHVVLTGLVGAVVVPILILGLLISIIGFPLGILALLLWLIVVILSGPFAGYTLGRLILKTEKNPFLIMLLGASLLLVSYFVPIIGLLTALAAYLFGTGMVLTTAKHRVAAPVQKAL